ncbi:uncharacterized protein METZ01_LOCUS249268 [marine metagenome]|uniref:Uncharacterized protein n=1 Tax=marine metagenome TaxID=408172 RepID=A0A382I9L2_9ZZZZ|tara:strand:+ start:24 stop:296 length:273 start_codon:yes stop_codon:yes gene_type:complete
MRIKILQMVGLLLIIPLIAMQLTDEVEWSLFDFIIMGTLLLITGLMGEIIFKKVKKYKHRVILYIVVIIIFFLIWAELSVGIFGTPFAGS